MTPETRSIWKYELPITDEVDLDTPWPAIARHVGHDPMGRLCVWIEVDLTGQPVRRSFRIRGTGHPFAQDEHETFLGSVVDGSFVWHIFEAQP